MENKILEGMIGLEIHTYLVTKEKLFCNCSASRERGLKGNINICPICTGMPGAKPMLANKSAVNSAIAIGLMLGCTINKELHWQRKHYSWPDLPKGYQNTLSGTYATPLGVNGEFFGIGIRSMHFEEDPASWTPDTGEIDYNRSGLPLVEIVTEPDFSNAEEVINWLKKLLHHLDYLMCVDTNAGIKVDVNVSIPNKSERVEIKNVNSLESIGKAIEYELKRQSKEGGQTKETRRYDDQKGITMVMRSKEDAQDYRFISDPDLQPLVFDEAFIENIRIKLPENPEKKLQKLIEVYKIDQKSAEILVKDVRIVEFFQKVIDKVEPSFALHWVTIELLRFLNYHDTTLDKVQINADHFIALLLLVKGGKITPLKGKEILNQFYPKSFMPNADEGKIIDLEVLEKFAKEVIQNNPKAVKDYNAGEAKSFDFLMGAIMASTKKRADYALSRKILLNLLSS